MLVSLSMTAASKNVTDIPPELINDAKSFIEETKNLNMTDLKNSIAKSASTEVQDITSNKGMTEDNTLKNSASQLLQRNHNDSIIRNGSGSHPNGLIVLSPSGTILNDKIQSGPTSFSIPTEPKMIIESLTRNVSVHNLVAVFSSNESLHSSGKDNLGKSLKSAKSSSLNNSAEFKPSDPQKSPGSPGSSRKLPVADSKNKMSSSPLSSNHAISTETEIIQQALSDVAEATSLLKAQLAAPSSNASIVTSLESETGNDPLIPIPKKVAPSLPRKVSNASGEMNLKVNGTSSTPPRRPSSAILDSNRAMSPEIIFAMQKATAAAQAAHAQRKSSVSSTDAPGSSSKRTSLTSEQLSALAKNALLTAKANPLSPEVQKELELARAASAAKESASKTDKELKTGNVLNGDSNDTSLSPSISVSVPSQMMKSPSEPSTKLFGNNGNKFGNLNPGDSNEIHDTIHHNKSEQYDSKLSGKGFRNRGYTTNTAPLLSSSSSSDDGSKSNFANSKALTNSKSDLSETNFGKLFTATSEINNKMVRDEV